MLIHLNLYPDQGSSDRLLKRLSKLIRHLLTEQFRQKLLQAIERVIAAVKKWRTDNPVQGAAFNLATGDVGVMAATNEEVKAKWLARKEEYRRLRAEGKV